MTAREHNWAGVRVEALLAWLHRVPDSRDALLRAVLVQRPHRSDWRPCFVRIDIARPGDPPVVEPDDLGRLRVVVERMAVRELVARLEELYGDVTGGTFTFDGSPIVQPFSTGWDHGFVGSNDRRAWGAGWPFESASASIADPPPLDSGFAEGRVYGPTKGTHALVRRVSGYSVYHDHSDPRYNQAHIYIWDYRARIVRCFVRNGQLVATVEHETGLEVRLHSVVQPGDRALQSLAGGGRLEMHVPEDAHFIQLELSAQAQCLDKDTAWPSNPLALPDGTQLPRGRAAKLLEAFPARRVWPGPIGEGYLRERLRDATRDSVTALEIQGLLRSLELDGLVEHVPIQITEEVTFPGMPRPGEPAWEATAAGLKAAHLLLMADSPARPWRLGDDRLQDQALLAIGRGEATTRKIDGACPTATSNDVVVAIGSAVERGAIERTEGDCFKLSDHGLVRYLQLQDELAEMANEEVVVRAAAAVSNAPTAIPLIPGFLRNSPLASLILRDRDELQKAMAGSIHKASLLLAGSILEGVLIDVLDRNRAVASTYLKQHEKWPDDASLARLVEIGSKTRVRLGDGSERLLLGTTATGTARSLTEHRDLIHPAAELRQQIRVSATSVNAMVALLAVVLEDLHEADKVGAIAAYEADNVC